MEAKGAAGPSPVGLGDEASVLKLPLPSFAWAEVGEKEGAPQGRSDNGSAVIGTTIYLFGGRNSNNGSLGDNEPPSLHVFYRYATDEMKWSKPIETKPPYEHNGEIFLKSVVIGDTIWIHDHGCFKAFDTKNATWLDVTAKNEDSSGYLSCENLVALDNKIYVYEGQNELQYFDTTAHTWHKPEAFGQIPYEKHGVWLFAIDSIILLFAPDDYSCKGGSLYAFDTKTGCWIQLAVDPTKLACCSGIFGERIGNYLVFVDASWGKPRDKATLIDLTTGAAKQVPISGEAPVHECSASANLVGDRFFLWGVKKESNLFHNILLNDLPSREQTAAFEAMFVKALASRVDPLRPVMKEEDPFVESEGPERDILIDDSLTPVPDWKNEESLALHHEIATDLRGLFRRTPVIDLRFLENTIPWDDTKRKDSKNSEEEKEKELSNDNKGVVLHKNYMHYLTLAWSNHFSVILSPDIVFYTLLCELADTIKGKPEEFRHLFTRSGGKVNINTLSMDPSKLDLNQILEKMKELSPVDPDMFTANFSTTTPEARLAHQAAFCEAMSAYYTYSNTLCGIPRIRVLGTKKDWVELESKVNLWCTSVFEKHKEQLKYLEKARGMIHDIHTNRDPEFWKNMFAISHCHSGHTDVVEGWIVRMYRKGYDHKRQGVVHWEGTDFYNYDSHISTVSWKNLETDKSFSLHSGLMYSRIDTSASDHELDKKYPFLLPQFAHVVRETTPGGISETDYDNYLQTLSHEDRSFLEEFRWAMTSGERVVLGGEDEKRTQKQNLILASVKLLLEKAKKGDTDDMIKDVVIPSGWTRHLGYEWNKPSKESREKNRKMNPALHQLAEAYAELLALGHTQSLEVGEDGIFAKNFLGPLVASLANVTSLRTLALTYLDEEDEPFLARLFENPACQIESLSLPPWSGKELTAALMASPAPLNSIELLGNDATTSTVAEFIAHRIMDRSKKPVSLSLGNNGSLEKEEAITIIEALATNPDGVKSIEGFLMGWVQSQKTDFKELEKPLGAFASFLTQTTTLESMQLDMRNELTKDALSQALMKNRSLRTMRLFTSSVSFLSTNETLESVDMSYCYLDDSAALELAATLRINKSLKHLNIMKGSISDVGGKALAEALCENNTLVTFMCRKHKMSQAVVPDWVKVIQANKTLKALDLGENPLRNIEAFLEALAGNTTLESATLGELGFKLIDDDAPRIAKLLSTNTTLQRLDLTCYQGAWAPESFTTVAEAIREHNHTLQRLSLNLNFRAKEMQPIIAQLARNCTEQGVKPPRYASLGEMMG